MKIVFLGTPDFAVESLKAIHEKSAHKVVGVVTMPDKRMGRGRKLQGSAVKNYAVENNIFLMQPEKLMNPEFIEQLRALQADLFVVVAFRMLPEVVWNMPPNGTVNVHASLLPQYRGAAPINWAIINGEKETGVTVFKLRHKIDAGDILLRKSTPIFDEDNAGTMHDKLMVLGAEALIEALNNIAAGSPKYIPQPESSDLKSAPKLNREGCRISWNMDVQSIHNFIRGLSPYPAAWTSFIYGGKEFTIKIFKSSFVQEEGTRPGTLDTDGKTFIRIAGSNGWVYVNEIQRMNKMRMKTEEMLRGISFS